MTMEEIFEMDAMRALQPLYEKAHSIGMLWALDGAVLDVRDALFAEQQRELTAGVTCEK